MRDKQKYVVEENVEFAGEKIRVKRVVVAGSAEESELAAKAAAQKKKDSLAKLVESLTEKKEISTLEKTKIDWAQDKEFAGDAAELEKAAKDGYLSKQSFLNTTAEKQALNDRQQRAVLRQRAAAAQGAGNSIFR